MKYFIDSSAWIEYLEGGAVGEKVWKILKGGNEIYVCGINVSEVISKVSRAGKDANVAFDSLMSNSKVVNLDGEGAKEAGLLHAKMKSENKSFGLADAIILTCAKKVGAKLVTKDSHFSGVSGVLVVG